MFTWKPRKQENRKSGEVKVFICVSFFWMHCAHFYSIYCFHDQGSHFLCIPHYVLYIIKKIYEICWRNSWSKKYPKLKIFLFEMKGIELNFSWKRALCFNKKVAFLIKGQLYNPDGELVGQSHPYQKIFLIQIKIKFLSKMALFN